jgi:hypothetical protein
LFVVFAVLLVLRACRVRAHRSVIGNRSTRHPPIVVVQQTAAVRDCVVDRHSSFISPVS